MEDFPPRNVNSDNKQRVPFKKIYHAKQIISIYNVDELKNDYHKR